MTPGQLTPSDWAVITAYIAAAALCLRAGSALAGDQRRSRLWFGLGLLLLALGLSKQVDLLSVVTGFGRSTAKAQGWYLQRRPVQAAFVLGALVIGLLSVTVVAIALRKAGWRLQLASFGLGALMTFIVIRAASSHRVDAMFDAHWGALKLNQVLELGGIALIAYPAATARAHRSPGRHLRAG